MDSNARARVVQVAGVDLSIQDRKAAEDVLGLGNDVLPAVALRMREVDGQDAVLGRVEIRAHVKEPLGELRIESRVLARHDGANRRFPGRLLEIELARSPAVVDGEEEELPLRDLARLDEGGGTVALAEELDVVFDRMSEDVETNARPVPARSRRVIETAPVLRERDSAVESAGETLGKVPRSVQLPHSYLDLVLSSLSNAIDQELSVRRYREDVDPGRPIVAHRVRVEDDLEVGGGLDAPELTLRGSAPPVDDGELVPRAPQREVLEVAALPRRSNLIETEELLQPRSETLPLRALAHDRLGMGGLSFDPGTGLGALLILEPSVGIGDLDAVEGIDDLDPAGSRAAEACRESKPSRPRERDPEASGGRPRSSFRRVELFERQCLVLEHDRDRIADGIDVLPVLAEEPGLDLLFDLHSSAVLDRARLDTGVDALDDLALDENDRLLGLGTAEDLEELGVDHGQ
jgi:hypothetical protein